MDRQRNLTTLVSFEPMDLRFEIIAEQFRVWLDCLQCHVDHLDERLTDVNSNPSVWKVAVQTPGLLTSAVSNVLAVFATTLVTLVLALFLLASGDLFYVKLIDAFPRFGDKKRALRIV